MIYQAARPLARIDTEMWRAYVTSKARWEALSKEAKQRTAPPKQTRIRIEDTTIEAAQEVLKDSSDGVLCLRDELSGWFGSMDKYAGHRGAATDRGFWLQAWNGGTYSYNRVSRGAGLIENLSVCVLGGIQPEPMRKLASDTVDDGLIPAYYSDHGSSRRNWDRRADARYRKAIRHPRQLSSQAEAVR